MNDERKEEEINTAALLDYLESEEFKAALVNLRDNIDGTVEKWAAVINESPIEKWAYRILFLTMHKYGFVYAARGNGREKSTNSGKIQMTISDPKTAAAFVSPHFREGDEKSAAWWIMSYTGQLIAMRKNYDRAAAESKRRGRQTRR